MVGILALLLGVALLGVVSGSDGDPAGDADPLPDPDDDITNPGTGRDLPIDPEEDLIGTVASDLLQGSDVAESIEAREGNDTVFAAGGADFVSGGIGDDYIEGGAGNDYIRGGLQHDTILGGFGNDFVSGGFGDDSLKGGKGDDWLTGIRGSDIIHGGDGDDYLLGWDSGNFLNDPDLLMGENGDDRLWGDDGDTLIGGEGTDAFDVTVDIEGAAPVIIEDLNAFSNDNSHDRVNFVFSDGTLIPREDLLDGRAGLEPSEDGNDTLVIYEGRTVAVLVGQNVEELRDETSWVGNFSPGSSGHYPGDDQINDTAANELIQAGAGDDTIISEFGMDFVSAQEGNDFISTVDNSISPGNDSVMGGEGDDTIRMDDGDIAAGQGGFDTYEMVLSQNGDPATIYGFQKSDDAIEILTFLDAGKNEIDPFLITQNLSITASSDGYSTVVSYGGKELVILDGVSPDGLEDFSKWIGNLDPVLPIDPVLAPIPDPVVGFEMKATTVAETGQTVAGDMFGANVVFSFNTDYGLPLPNLQQALESLNVDHVRFPGGQGEVNEDGVDADGEAWLNVVQMEPNESGVLDLRPELRDFLDWAADPNGDGNPDDRKTVSLVIPTKHVPLDDYQDFAVEIEAFAQKVAEDYGDLVTAVEIGNEYWSLLTETEYAAKADIAAKALDKGFEAAGLADEDQPSIIVQMATPNTTSEFHSSKDSRGYTDRLVDANQKIIDGLSDEARDAIDGVVEHYYFKRTGEEFTDQPDEMNYIARDYQVWDENFSKDLEIHITEWNVKSSNPVQNGIRAASTLIESFENMVELGVEDAQAWPTQHNTTNDLAGGKNAFSYLGPNGEMLDNVRGATFQLMSANLVGAELLDVEFANDDGSIEINVYQSDTQTVAYISSRSLEVETVSVDLTAAVDSVSSIEATRVGYDASPESSDGVMYTSGQFVEAEFVDVDGNRYYTNEHDVRATLTDIQVSDISDVAVTLKPFEVLQVVITA